METVDVIVASYGSDDLWDYLSDRAIASVERQTHKPEAIWRVHEAEGTDLSTCRNLGASYSTSDWLIFLDADDELDEGYIEAMLAGEGGLRWPSTIGIGVDGKPDDYPVLLQPKADNFLVGNHMVIGTMVRRELFYKAGGFRQGMTMLEDWDLWIRCLLAGGKAKPCPAALYKVHVRSDSRNQNVEMHNGTYAEIQGRYKDQWNLLSLS